MSLINAVRPIIGSKTAKVTLEVSANPKVEGEMVLVARPVVGPVAASASEELKQLCAALASPIKVIGTPDVIERELEAAVREQAGHRSTWATRAAQIEALIASGAAKDGKKTGGESGDKAMPVSSQPSASAATSTKPFSL